ncbi:3-keto-5-aminohexanoate cleavage protein [Marinactinospora rubrisoli]|uniref:3-keto-5-aminohexanoate cleavage protein n=1 Tax=Marinactinospora rubrisoli TaxID=2715399 RepID=A0ABW2K926_9ACTN
MRIVACLNGDRRPGAHPALPVSPDQVAADARWVVAAGATEVHVHPRDGRGDQALEPQVLTPLLEKLRAAVPGVPISVTTGLSAEPDPWRRYDLVQRWGALPDSATVHLDEPGAMEVARLLIDRQVDLEAALRSVQAARILTVSGLAEEFTHVVIEPREPTVAQALETVTAIEAVLDRAGVTLPRLLHGTERTAWPLLDTAIAADRDIRIGLEDTLLGPDGTETEDNAALVSAAVARISAHA